MRLQRGFTLLELLIAIAIFALLALATYRMFDSVMQTDQATSACASWCGRWARWSAT